MPEERVSILVQMRDQISKPLTDSQKRLKEFQTRVDAVNRRISPLAKNVAGLAAAFLGFAAARRAVTDIVAFEQGLVGVAKTANLTDSEMKALGDDILALAQKTPVAVTELLSIAQAAGQLGIQGRENLLKFTDTVARLGVASDLAGEEAATVLARLLTVTGESVQSVDKLASVFVALGNNFAATEREIALTATQVAQAGAVFGITSAEAAAFGAALRQLGVRAELSGNTIGKSFRAIDAAVRGSGTQLAEIAQITGRTADEFARTFQESPVRGLQIFLEGLGQVVARGESVAPVLERIGLSGDEVNKVIPTLAKNSDVLAKAFLQAGIESEGFGKTLERVFRSAEAAVEQSGDRLAEVAELAGQTSEAFTSSFRATPTQAIVDLVSGLARVAAEGGEAAEGLKELGLSSDDLERVLPRLASNTDALSKVLESAGGNIAGLGNALLTESERGFQTFGSDIERLKNSLFSLNVALGESGAKGEAQGFIGVLAQAIAILAGVNGALGKASGAALGLARTIRAVALAAAAFVAGKILGFLLQLASLLRSAAAAVGLLTTAIRANPIGLFASALAVIIGSIAFFTSEATEAAAAQERLNDEMDRFRVLQERIRGIPTAKRAAERTETLEDDIRARNNELLQLEDRLTAIQAQLDREGPQAVLGPQERQILVDLELIPQVPEGIQSDLLKNVEPRIRELLTRITPDNLIPITVEDALGRIASRIGDLRTEIDALQQRAAGTPEDVAAPTELEAQLARRREDLVRLNRELGEIQRRAKTAGDTFGDILTRERTELLAALGVDIPVVEVPVAIDVQNEQLVGAIGQRASELRGEIIALDHEIRRLADAEKFAPFLDSLDQQIALVGAVTEAEKRRLTAEQQARDFARDQGFSDEQTRRLLDLLQERILLLDEATQKSGALTDSEKLRDSLRRGFFSLVTQVDAEVTSLQDEIDTIGLDEDAREAALAVREAERLARLASADASKEESDAINDALDSFKKDVEARRRLRAGDRVSQREADVTADIRDETAAFSEAQRIIQQYGLQIRDVDSALSIARLTIAQHNDLVLRGAENVDAKTEAYRRQLIELEKLIVKEERRTPQDQRNLRSRQVLDQGPGDVIGGAGAELQDFANQAADLENVGRNIAGTFVNAFQQISLAIAGVDTNWREFARNFLAQIAAIILQAIVARAVLSAIGFNSGGAVPDTGAVPIERAEGGSIPGPDVQRDVVPALLTPREWVIQRGSALYYGDRLMSAINQRLIPKEALLRAITGPVSQVHPVSVQYQSGGPARRADPNFGESFQPVYLPNDEQTGERMIRGGMSRPLLRFLSDHGFRPASGSDRRRR